MSEPAGRVERIRSALQSRLAPRALTITDDSAAHAGHAGAREGGHFHVHVISERFQGRSTLQRHRLVYEAVEALMGRDIHALSIRAETPEETRADAVAIS
jgi:BolA family transcriptional regulator, general stress-responsive regulator